MLVKEKLSKEALEKTQKEKGTKVRHIIIGRHSALDKRLVLLLLLLKSYISTHRQRKIKVKIK